MLVKSPNAKHFVIIVTIGLILIIYLVLKSNSTYGDENLNVLNFIASTTTRVVVTVTSEIARTLEPLNLIFVGNLTKSHLVPNNGSHGDNDASRTSKDNFTIILLTHNRIQHLHLNLLHLNGLAKVDKVIVIWNQNQLQRFAQEEFKWPNTTYKLEVYFASTNTLNNRFLPLKSINTLGILSLDDDVFVSHRKLLFAFNVWTQFPDQLVGFPARSHEFNEASGKFQYVAHPKETLSLILTGNAFFHSKYLYQYTYEMSSLIRDRVDTTMNCEDLAMNFLIGNSTGKPPIKVTKDIEWSYEVVIGGSYADLPEKIPEDDSLWKNSSHFEERDECLNYFAKIYGHMPLSYTNFRIESLAYLEVESPRESFPMEVYKHWTKAQQTRHGNSGLLFLIFAILVIFILIGSLVCIINYFSCTSKIIDDDRSSMESLRNRDRSYLE